MQLSVFDRAVYSGEFRGGKEKEIYDQPIAKLPFFAFFLVTEDFIAARGRGGGLALWVKETWTFPSASSAEYQFHPIQASATTPAGKTQVWASQWIWRYYDPAKLS